jgi:hypothetical protein
MEAPADGAATTFSSRRRGCAVMRAAPLLALSALLLAGCSSAPPPSAPSQSVTTFTDPAAVAANATGAHFHDYWHGQRQLLVLEASHPGGTAEGAGPGLAGGASVPVMRFRPESGSVVPQGAASVEVTLSWADAPGDSYARPELWIKTAATNETRLVAAIHDGETVSVPSTNADDDLPHQLLSAWVFELRMSSPDPMPLRFKGSVSARAEAVRGLDIPLYPVHPDRWENQTVLPLLEANGELQYAEDPVDHGCNGSACPRALVPDDGRIVPYDAGHVEAVLESDGVPGLVLAWHGGGSRDFAAAEPDAQQGNVRHYTLPIDGGDGPYAVQSQWEFTVLPAPTPAGHAAVEATYRLTVTVHHR